MAKSSIQVPKAAAPAFQELAGLDNAVQQRLVNALNDERAVSAADLASLVAGVVEGWDESKARSFLQHILGMSVAASSYGYEASDVAESVSKSPALDLGLPDGDAAQRFRTTLEGLVNAPAVKRVAKAVDLIQERDRLVQLVRIVTDVRPVFADDLVAPTAALVLHDLRLTYHEDGEFHTFSAALDHSDLLNLQSAVKRAIEKSELLKSWLSQHELADLTEAIESGDV